MASKITAGQNKMYVLCAQKHKSARAHIQSSTRPSRPDRNVMHQTIGTSHKYMATMARAGARSSFDINFWFCKCFVVYVVKCTHNVRICRHVVNCPTEATPSTQCNACDWLTMLLAAIHNNILIFFRPLWIRHVPVVFNAWTTAL